MPDYLVVVCIVVATVTLGAFKSLLSPFGVVFQITGVAINCQDFTPFSSGKREPVNYLSPHQLDYCLL